MKTNRRFFEYTFSSEILMSKLLSQKVFTLKDTNHRYFEPLIILKNSFQINATREALQLLQF